MRAAVGKSARRGLAAGAAALALTLVAWAVPPALFAFPLEGTWYVLVHYQDRETASPEAWRWDDRVWRFEAEGDRVVWTEWPIVVFDDESGRFESRRGGRPSRVLAAWDPSERQLQDIRSGLQTNSRGMKVKTLAPLDGERVWRSTTQAVAESASILSYTETWSIEGLPELPRFVLDDVLGAARTETLEGRTLYATEEVTPDGELRGRFERDGTRFGRFRMIPSGETQRVRGSGLTQSERLMQMFASLVGLTLTAEELEALRTGALTPGVEVPEEMRAEARQQIRRDVEQAFRDQGQDPRRFAPQVQSLTRQIERLLLDEGKSPDEVQRMIEAGEIRP